jgi:hypothetical protein
MTAYHQMNGNGLSVMACAHNEEAFIAIMRDRFDPLSYQRPTADPTSGQAENAIQLLGEFTNTLMTTQQALTEHGAVEFSPPTVTVSDEDAVKCEHEQENTVSAFNKMKEAAAATAGKSFTAAHFASRVHKENPNTTDETISSLPQTLKELLAVPGVQLEVMSTSHLPAAAFTTTMGRDAIKHPFLWAFYPGSTPEDFHITTWCTVTSILPMSFEAGRHRSFIFVCANAVPIKLLPNCCFPSNLQPEYARTCRTAYEKLNKMVSPSIPPLEEGPFSIGVGTSITGADGTLCRPLHLRVNGQEIVLSKWG